MRKSVSLMSVVLMIVTLLAGCAPAAGAPTATPDAVEPPRVSAEPSADATGGQTAPEEPAATPDDANALRIVWIVSAKDGDAQWMGNRLVALRDLLRPVGWHIQPAVIEVDDADDPKIAATPADAFVASPALAARLLEKGIVQDVTALAARDAPVLADRYADYLAQNAAGVPLSVHRSRVRRLLGLAIQKDKAPADALERFGSVSDVVAWLEDNPDMHLGRGMAGVSGAAPFRTTLELWAGEQGYRTLAFNGVRGGLYARLDDPKATPVPLESIDGFAVFYERLVALWNSGQLFDVANRSNEHSIGYLGPVFLELDEGYLREKELSGSDYLAVPLAGDAYRLPPAPAQAGSLMAISTTSRRAGDMLKLAEWAMTTREGYDLCRYGVLDMDYELVGDRVSPVEERPHGAALGLLAADDAMERKMVSGAANTEEIDATENPGLPVLAWALDKDRFQYENSALQAVAEANQKLIQDRENLLYGLLPADDDAGQPVTKASAAFKLLDALKPRTAELVQAYQTELVKMAKE